MKRELKDSMSASPAALTTLTVYFALKRSFISALMRAMLAARCCNSLFGKR